RHRRSASTGELQIGPASLAALGSGGLRFRDLFDDRGGSLRLTESRRYVSLRDDADDLPVVVYYRNPPHLVLFHCVERFLQVVIRPARNGASGHHVLYSRTGNVATFGHDHECQISIGNDS